MPLSGLLSGFRYDQFCGITKGAGRIAEVAARYLGCRKADGYR